MSIPTILSVFGLGPYVGIYNMRGYAYGLGIGYIFVVTFLVLNVVLRGLSVQPLFSKSIKGWNLFFYATLLYFVYTIFSFDIVSGIINTLISLYLLFQVKEYYK